MSGSPNVLSLPDEIVHYISDFLKPPDLLALSATCQRLRSALNYNCVWHKYSRGGAVSQVLKSVTSIVKPTFNYTEDVNSTLEPLCDNRLHFSRQTRLFNNYSKGKFVQTSVPFEGSLSDFETFNLCSDRQITYKDQYLFSLCYSEEVKVFNIKADTRLLVTFKLIRHEISPNYCKVTWLRVVEDKLVIRQDNWLDVYDIRLPDLEFPLLHSIDVKTCLSVYDSSFIVVRDLVIAENQSSSSSNVVSIWNLSSGVRLDVIKPKIEGLDVIICNFPGEKQDILFSVEVSNGGDPFVTPHLFVYCLRTFQYTNFHAVLPFKLVSTDRRDYFGLMDNNYVLLLRERQEWTVDIFVYDMKSSALLAQNSLEVLNKSNSCIVNGYLALCKLSSLHIINISNLETIWKIEFEAPPQSVMLFVRFNIHCVDMMSLNHLIFVGTYRSMEVWSLENRKKCFVLPKNSWFVAINDSFTKLVTLKDRNLEILTFW